MYGNKHKNQVVRDSFVQPRVISSEAGVNQLHVICMQVIVTRGHGPHILVSTFALVSCTRRRETIWNFSDPQFLPLYQRDPHFLILLAIESTWIIRFGVCTMGRERYQLVGFS